MSDTTPESNPKPFPFTRQELTDAFRLILADDVVEVMMEEAYGKGDVLRGGVQMMDGTYYLLAALSPELAARVVAYRPDLAEAVRRVRRDPQGYIEAMREQSRWR